jgi:hypothetical protein
MALAVFVIANDVTALSVALPAIERDFDVARKRAPSLTRRSPMRRSRRASAARQRVASIASPTRESFAA